MLEISQNDNEASYNRVVDRCVIHMSHADFFFEIRKSDMCIPSVFCILKSIKVHVESTFCRITKYFAMS